MWSVSTVLVIDVYAIFCMKYQLWNFGDIAYELITPIFIFKTSTVQYTDDVKCNNSELKVFFRVTYELYHGK